MNVVYNPPSGLPPITVGQAEIFNGYFSFFGLQDIPFDYVMSDGTVLFSGLTLDPATSALLNGPTGSRAVAFIPANISVGGGSGQDPDNLLYFGFFGPAASGSQGACYAPSGTLSNVTSFAGQSINWVGTATGTPWATLQTSGQGGVFSGGTGQTCSGATNYVNYMFLSLAGVTGRDSALGFHGPYSTDGYSGLTLTQTTPGLAVAWSYLPGTTSGIDGTEIFYLPGGGTSSQTAKTDPPYRNQVGFACDQLVSKYGFISAGQVSSASSSLTIPGLSTSSDLLVVACPYKTGLLSGTTYFSSALSGAQVPPPCSSTYQISSAFSASMQNYGSIVSPVGGNACSVAIAAANSQPTYVYALPSAGAATASKFYFEVSIDQLDPSGAFVGIGVTTPSWVATYNANSMAPDYYLGQDINSNTSQNGAIFYSGMTNAGYAVQGPVAPNVAYSAGDVLGLAVDTTVGQVWVYLNGNAYSATPWATVSGLITPTGGAVPVVSIYSPGGGQLTQATLITKGSSLRHAPPTGYSVVEP